MNSAAYTLPPTSLMSPIPPRVSGQAFASQATNDPAIQTMQRDNTSLVSAYSAAQNRIAHLDEELRAAKLEIAKLAKERQKLNAKIDLLEAEIDELQNSIDLSQQDNAAKDNQYSQILKLATKLETHGVANAQHRKTEQQQWTHYRQDRETLIAMLMSEVKDLRSGIQRSTTSQSEASGLPGRDQGGLSGQSGALRHMNTRMEKSMIGIRQEHAHLTQCIEKLGNIGSNIQTHLKSMEGNDAIPYVPND